MLLSLRTANRPECAEDWESVSEEGRHKMQQIWHEREVLLFHLLLGTARKVMESPW